MNGGVPMGVVKNRMIFVQVHRSPNVAVLIVMVKMMSGMFQVLLAVILGGVEEEIET